MVPRLRRGILLGLLAAFGTPAALGAPPGSSDAAAASVDALRIVPGRLRAVLESASAPFSADPAPATVDAAPAPPPAPAPAVSVVVDPRERALLRRVILVDHGKPEERALLEGILRRLLASPSCAEPIAQLLRETRPVSMALDPVPGTSIQEVNGKRYLNGLAGTTDPGPATIQIVLNNALLQTEPDYAAENFDSLVKSPDAWSPV